MGSRSSPQQPGEGANVIVQDAMQQLTGYIDDLRAGRIQDTGLTVGPGEDQHNLPFDKAVEFYEKQGEIQPGSAGVLKAAYQNALQQQGHSPEDVAQTGIHRVADLAAPGVSAEKQKSLAYQQLSEDLATARQKNVYPHCQEFSYPGATKDQPAPLIKGIFYARDIRDITDKEAYQLAADCIEYMSTNELFVVASLISLTKEKTISESEFYNLLDLCSKKELEMMREEIAAFIEAPQPNVARINPKTKAAEEATTVIVPQRNTRNRALKAIGGALAAGAAAAAIWGATREPISPPATASRPVAAASSPSSPEPEPAIPKITVPQTPQVPIAPPTVAKTAPKPVTTPVPSAPEAAPRPPGPKPSPQAMPPSPEAAPKPAATPEAPQPAPETAPESRDSIPTVYKQVGANVKIDIAASKAGWEAAGWEVDTNISPMGKRTLTFTKDTATFTVSADAPNAQPGQGKLDIPPTP